MVSLAEVQVFSAGRRVERPARQPRVRPTSPDRRSMQSTVTPMLENKSVTHTAVSDNPWWELDLTKDVAIDRIVVEIGLERSLSATGELPSVNDGC